MLYLNYISNNIIKPAEGSTCTNVVFKSWQLGDVDAAGFAPHVQMLYLNAY